MLLKHANKNPDLTSKIVRQSKIYFQHLLNDDTPIPNLFDNVIESTTAQTNHAVAELEALNFHQLLYDETLTPQFGPTNAARELVLEAPEFEQLLLPSNDKTDPTQNLLPNFGKTEHITELVEIPITEAAIRLENEQFMLIFDGGTPHAPIKSCSCS
ncbi:hypothetical protein VNO77_32084 [Canavalia gladiata]|uniref:Uncharacterized protein n=1 Tax=Canavalia gladiata TaxID=3824 RepID=A0AAN9KQX2_CANGL